MERHVVHRQRLQLRDVLAADVIQILDGREWRDVRQGGLVGVPEPSKYQVVDHQIDLGSELLHVRRIRSFDPGLLYFHLTCLAKMQARLRLVLLRPGFKVAQCHGPELPTIQLFTDVFKAGLPRTLRLLELEEALLVLTTKELHLDPWPPHPVHPKQSSSPAPTARSETKPRTYLRPGYHVQSQLTLSYLQ